MSSRKQFNRYEPPSPSVTGDEDRDESFLNDATKLYDVLPQPFRRIDKLINEIFDLAWERIEKRNQEKVQKGSSQVNIQNVIYEEELLVKDDVRCLAVTRSLLFLGATNKITVYRLPEWKQVTVYEWPDNNQDDAGDKDAPQEEPMGDGITLSETTSVENLSVIVSVDDLVVLAAFDSDGVLRILAFQEEIFCLIETLSPPVLDSVSSEAHVVDLLVSDDGTVLTVTWSNTKSNSTWLDVYKVPTEMWIQELQHSMQHKDVGDQEEEPATAEEEKSSPDFHKLIHQFKLVAPEVRPSAHSLSSVMKNLDSEAPHTVTGTHHCLTSNFLKHLSDEFKWKCNIPTDTDLMATRQTPLPHLHFLRGQLQGNLFPSHCPVADAGYNALAVRWEEHNILYFYHVKLAKDIPEPFATLPHAATIMASTVNLTTNLVATYISNGCVTVWNRYLGYPVKIFHSAQPITMLHFSRVSGTPCEDKLTYLTRTGQLYQVVCLKTDIGEPVCLDDRSSPLLENGGLLCRVDGPENLLTLIWSCGEIIMYNQRTSSALCQLEIFNDEYNSNTDRNNDSDNNKNSCKDVVIPLQAVYAKPNLIVMRHEGDNCCRLFLFDLASAPLLQPFMKEDEPQTMGTCGNDRIDSLQKYCDNFVNSCKKEEKELAKRVDARYRQLLKT